MLRTFTKKALRFRNPNGIFTNRLTRSVTKKIPDLNDPSRKIHNNRIFYLAPRRFFVWNRITICISILVPVWYIFPKYTINTFMSQVRARNKKLEELQQLDTNQLNEIDLSKVKLKRIDDASELGGEDFMNEFNLSGGKLNLSLQSDLIQRKMKSYPKAVMTMWQYSRGNLAHSTSSGMR